MLLASLPAAATSFIIDAGHGSPDGGSVGYAGTEEKDLNLALAKSIRSWCRFLGISYRMTREGDEAIYSPSSETIHEKKVSDLQNRLKLAEETEDALFLSIHMNASPTKSAHGLEVFYAPSEASDKLAETLTAVFLDSVHEERVKDAKAAPKSVYLMKHLSCPAVILEYGFISNPNEEQLLLREEYQWRLAYLTVCGSLSYIDHKG